jgi:SagB-type dehydrogenase family enzyme
MTDSLFLSLREGASLAARGAKRLVLQYQEWSMTISAPSSGIRAALRRLGDAGEYEDKLAESVLEGDGLNALAEFYYYLNRLSQARLLLRSVRLRGKRLATLVPISPNFEYVSRSVERGRRYVLSRFAYMRNESGELVLESPLSHARVVVHDGRAAALVHALARPMRVKESGEQFSGLTAKAVRQLTTLLLEARMLSEVGDASEAVEDEKPSLKSWEFHDLLFHSRSRQGRHDQPTGGTYRFVGQLDPPPALKPSVSDDVIRLYRPDMERRRRDDPPFALVQETRRSIREYGAKPMALRELSEFLYRVGRVRRGYEAEVPTPRGPFRMKFAPRPYPSGGALYELELYPVVRACENLAPGLYHYGAREHQLERVSDMTAHAEGLLSVASWSTDIPREHLQVLIVIAARFQRMSWKYSSVAYAAILKHVGVLYQTMYLVATAMGLAPCGMGIGDADLFAGAAGTGYYDETSVGEFLLGSKGDAVASPNGDETHGRIAGGRQTA